MKTSTISILEDTTKELFVNNKNFEIWPKKGKVLS